MPNYLNKVVYLTDAQYASLCANPNTTIGGHKYDPNTLYITNTPGNASTVNGHTVDINVPFDAVFTDTNKYHSSGSWSGLTYTANSIGGAETLAFTVPNKIQTNWELNATSGNSPALLFTRDGTSLVDWKIQVIAGKLSFQSANDASTWTEQAFFSSSGGNFTTTGTVTATAFIGPAKYLQNYSGTDVAIGDGTWAVQKVPTGYTNKAVVWRQNWSQSGLKFTQNGSEQASTDNGNLIFYLASNNTANEQCLNIQLDGLIYAAQGFVGSLDGNAKTATTATNLSAKPSLAAGTTDINSITVTAGGKISSEFTVPYATKATTATILDPVDISNTTTATNLDNLTEAYRIYYAGGTNSVVNNPNGNSTAFGLTVSRIASGYRLQDLINTSGKRSYRIWNGSSWGDWYNILTSSNTSAADSNGNAISVTCGTDTTLATINGITVALNVTVPSFNDLSLHPTTLSGYGITDGLQFAGNIKTPIGNDSPHNTVKTWWESTTNVPKLKMVAAYNNGGKECSFLFSKGNADATYGTVLRWGYTDRYIYILRKNNASSWLSSDWEKTYAGYADSAGALSNYYSTRQTNINITHIANGGVIHFKADESELAKDGNNPDIDGSILHFFWDTNDGWDGQLLIPTSHSYSMKWRAHKNKTTWGDNWHTLLDEANTKQTSVPELSWGTTSTIFTINGTNIQITAMAKPSPSEIGAAAASEACTATNVNAILKINTSSGDTNKWLNQKGDWDTPSPSDIGASPSDHTHNYAGSDSAGGAANSVVTAKDTSNTLYLVGVVNDTTTNALKYNTSMTMNNGLLTIGNTQIGQLFVGTATANTAGKYERKLGVCNGSGQLYLFATAATTGDKGLYSYKKDQSTGGYILKIDQNNKISEIAEITGTLVLSKTQDATSTASENLPALIVGGTAAQTHLELDSNEIMAKTVSNNQPTTSPLYLNYEGNAIIMGATTSNENDYVSIRSTKNATSDTDGALRVGGGISVKNAIYMCGKLTIDKSTAGAIYMTRGTNSTSANWIQTGTGQSIAFCIHDTLQESNASFKITDSDITSYNNEKASLGTSSVQWNGTYSKTFIVNQHVTLQWNTTDSSLDFIFS